MCAFVHFLFNQFGQPIEATDDNLEQWCSIVANLLSYEGETLILAPWMIADSSENTMQTLQLLISSANLNKK